MQEIHLPAATPRPLDAVTRQLDLRKGLYTGYVFGAVFLVGAVFLPVAVALTPQPWSGPKFFQAIAGPLFFAGFAMLFVLPARRRYRDRVDAFVNGELVSARVVRHRRGFAAYSSFRDYLIDAEARLADGRMATGTIRTRSARLANSLPSGTELQALALTDKARLFLPIEMGVGIEID